MVVLLSKNVSMEIVTLGVRRVLTIEWIGDLIALLYLIPIRPASHSKRLESCKYSYLFQASGSFVVDMDTKLCIKRQSRRVCDKLVLAIKNAVTG